MENKNFDYNEEFDKKLIEDHDYDGIHELDNPPPPWLMYLFYITIVFAIAYAAYYHWTGAGLLQAAEYEQEMADAAEKYKASSSFDLNNISLKTDEATLAAAEKTFKTSCAACHGANGEGNAIGPNLTDEYWITGNTPKTVYQTIKNGTPNGMTAFSSIPDEQILGLASYILNKLKGSNPENAKEPQGEKM